MNRVFVWDWCRLDRVVDGDTLIMIIDRGFHDIRTERLRLLGINCPEVTGATRQAGQAAKDFTIQKLDEWAAAAPEKEWPLAINTHKTDSFGRYLADVFGHGINQSLSDLILEAGHAVVDIR